ncbi:MAG: hypothetical protein GY756_00440 [bacterium]|nr:hypothetical protein [bacterium]
MIIDIDHINIVVTDIDKTVKFFNILGFQMGESATLEGEWISDMLKLDNACAEYVSLSLPDSKFNIELLKFNTPVSESVELNSKTNTIGYRHFSLKVKDLEKEINNLKKHNISFISKPQQKGNRKGVYFIGPDNIIIQLDETL